MLGRTAVSKGCIGLAGVVDAGCDGFADDELLTLPGFVKAFKRRSLSSTIMPFEASGFLTTFRFGTKMVGCLIVRSTGFETTGCL